jgi:hypothetical protein
MMSHSVDCCCSQCDISILYQYLVVSDLHVSLKTSEIRILIILRMNHGFMEYMRKTYPNTPLSEFKTTDDYVRTHGLDNLVDDEEEERLHQFSLHFVKKI